MHKARKRFGQNFLTNFAIIQDIVKGIRPRENDNLVEIGPGLGALTEHLLENNVHLSAIEIDRDLIEKLNHKFQDKNFTLYNQDVLKFDFHQLGKDLRIVGNLPYNISTPLLFHLLEFKDLIKDMHFMLQKEVVDRITADKGSKQYGRLSIMIQYHYETEFLFKVPPSAFKPAPKVDSAIVRLIPHKELPIQSKNENQLKEIVTAAFNKRRKTIQNSLKSYITKEQLLEIGIDPNSRAETLSMEEFVKISNQNG